MVTLGETAQDEAASDKSHQRKKADNPEGSTLSVLAEKGPGELQKTRDPKAEFSKSEGNKEGNAVSVKTEKQLGSIQQIQRRNRTSTDQTFQEGSSVPVKPGVSHNLKEKRYLDSASGEHTCKDDQEGTSLSTVADESVYDFHQRQSSDTGAHALQSDQEGSNLSVVPEKVQDSLQFTQNLEVRRDQEGRTPSRIPDKPSEDGYNWRKYGQKFVKGNEFTRSYYRCTHPNCPAKRQVERSHDGHITDIVYLGKHEHPKPQPSAQVAIGVVQPIQSIQIDKPSTSIGEDKSSSPHGPTSCHAEPTENSQLPRVEPTNDAVECEISKSSRIRDEVENTGDSDSKRLKIDKCNIDEIPVEKPNGERKVVVQTRSLVDIVNDGYRWRKYGQKLVKGNPNPRSYYRCSNVGCPVKKHVERASHDPKVVVTTYEGQHVHDMPPTRTVTPNAAGSSTNIDAHDGESKPKSEESNAVSLDVVVHVSSS